MACQSEDPELRFTRLIRFYPDGEVRLKFAKGIIHSFRDWEYSKRGSSFSLQGNTASFRLETGDKGVEFSECTFWDSGLTTKMKSEDGLTRQVWFQFIPDDPRCTCRNPYHVESH